MHRSRDLLDLAKIAQLAPPYPTKLLIKAIQFLLKKDKEGNNF